MEGMPPMSLPEDEMGVKLIIIIIIIIVNLKLQIKKCCSTNVKANVSEQWRLAEERIVSLCNYFSEWWSLLSRVNGGVPFVEWLVKFVLQHEEWVRARWRRVKFVL